MTYTTRIRGVIAVEMIDLREKADEFRKEYIDAMRCWSKDNESGWSELYVKIKDGEGGRFSISWGIGKTIKKTSEKKGMWVMGKYLKIGSTGLRYMPRTMGIHARGKRLEVALAAEEEFFRIRNAMHNWRCIEKQLNSIDQSAEEYGLE